MAVFYPFFQTSRLFHHIPNEIWRSRLITTITAGGYSTLVQQYCNSASWHFCHAESREASSLDTQQPTLDLTLPFGEGRGEAPTIGGNLLPLSPQHHSRRLPIHHRKVQHYAQVHHVHLRRSIRPKAGHTFRAGP